MGRWVGNCVRERLPGVVSRTQKGHQKGQGWGKLGLKTGPGLCLGIHVWGLVFRQFGSWRRRLVSSPTATFSPKAEPKAELTQESTPLGKS